MPVYEIEGVEVEFDREPSEQDIDEAAKQLGLVPKQSQEEQAQTNKPDFIDALSGGIEKIPADRPYARATYQTAKDIATIPAHFFNQRLLNYPRAILNKFGVGFPEAESDTGKILSKGAGVVGGVQSGAALVQKFGLQSAKGAVKTALKSGGLAASYADTEKPFDVKQNMAEFGGGALFGGVAKAGQNIFQSINRATSGAPAFARRVREGFVNKKIESMKKFGADLDKYTEQFPDRSISLSEIMKEAQATSPYDQKLNSFIKGNEQLKKLVDNPQLANNMPVKEVQTLLNKINPKIQGKYGADFLEVKDFVHDIKAAQLDAFPEMAQTREMYAKVAEPYRIIKSKIREGALLQNLANKFGDPELNARAESLMTKELKAEVANYRRTRKLLTAAGLTAGTAVGSGIAGTVFKAFNR